MSHCIFFWQNESKKKRQMVILSVLSLLWLKNDSLLQTRKSETLPFPASMLFPLLLTFRSSMKSQSSTPRPSVSQHYFWECYKKAWVGNTEDLPVSQGEGRAASTALSPPQSWALESEDWLSLPTVSSYEVVGTCVTVTIHTKRLAWVSFPQTFLLIFGSWHQNQCKT